MRVVTVTVVTVTVVIFATVVIVTVAIVAAGTVVIVKYFSKNNLTPRQQMRYSQGSFSRFSRCFLSKVIFDLKPYSSTGKGGKEVGGKTAFCCPNKIIFLEEQNH